MSSSVTAWDAWARSATTEPMPAEGWQTWFSWADPGVQPGVSVLRPYKGARIIDLGCGTGRHVAHLATLGVKAVGVDSSSAALDVADGRWGHLPGLRYEHSDAADYLNRTAGTLDAIYSCFGAAWFSDPDRLLPAVFARLRPHGLFAFSHAIKARGPYGWEPRRDNPSIKRWDYAPDRWARLLVNHGFVEVAHRVLPPVERFPAMVTMLMVALRPARIRRLLPRKSVTRIEVDRPWLTGTTGIRLKCTT